ncbi:MAG: PilZ domain-containing protein [Candidatus Omnitrophica bacterium]|nr:hypothetical protein [bacterium]NUN98255.1 PilZ domain-containing protein [Candidatus Omnitrophota bacterium]
MTNPENLRQHVRLQARVRIEFKLVGSSAAIKGMNYREAFTRDISAGGVFIELLDTHLTQQRESVVDDFLLFKSQIDMQISLPVRDKPIHAIGKAVWIEKEVPGREYRHGIAISFTEIDQADRQAIDQYVLSKI